MRRLFLLLILAVAAFGQGTALTAFAQGAPLTPNTWTDLSPSNSSATDFVSYPGAYDSCAFTGASHASVVCWVSNLTLGYTSEWQTTLMEYNYAQNRRTVLVNGGGFHSTHRPSGGHQMGVQLYVPTWDSVIWQTDDSFGNTPDNYITMGGYDMSGHTGFTVPVMTTSGAYTREWYSSGQLNAATYEPVSGKVVFFPDHRGSTGDITYCTPGSGLSMTCTNAAATSGDPNFVSMGMTASGSHGLVYLFGGGAATGTASNALYSWSLGAGWTLVSTTCTGADCVGGSPAARFNMGFAYSSDDDLILMVGGTAAPEGSGTAFQDTWTFNPNTNAWNELCNTTGGCAGFVQASNAPGNRLAYDSFNHVFLWLELVGNSFSTTGHVEAFALGTPLDYGRTAFSAGPAAGSLNISAPNSVAPSVGNNTQAWSSDPSISISGSTIYVSHSETGTPAMSGNNCASTTSPFVGTVTASGSVSSSTISYLPSTGFLAACNAMGSNIRLGAGYFPYTANIGGTLWNTYTRENWGAGAGSVSTHPIVQQWNASGNSANGNTPAWYVNNFPPQAPGGSISAGSNTITLSPFPTGVTVNSVLLLKAGTGAAEFVPVTAVSSPTITVTATGTHTGAWTIQDTGWIGCFLRTCNFTGADPKIVQYPAGLIGVGTTPTLAVIEQDKGLTLSDRENYLFVAQPVAGVWTSLSGSTPLDIVAVGSGTHVESAQIATDGGGTNILACWAERTDNATTRYLMTTPPQIFCKLWNGSSWTQLSGSGTNGSINQSTSDWAYNPSPVYFSGSWYVAFTERTPTGWPNVYVKKWSGSAWSLVGPGSLNINTSTGIAYHPSLTTDGTNLYVAWEEQVAQGSHSLGYVKYGTGSSWATWASAVAADPTNGSIEDIGIVASSGTVTAAWTETTLGNLRQVYSTTLTGPGGNVGGTLFSGILQLIGNIIMR